MSQPAAVVAKHIQHFSDNKTWGLSGSLNLVFVQTVNVC